MDAAQQEVRNKHTPPESDPTKIDPEVPAGSEGSLGMESVHEVRPQTDDSVVEAMDEETPGVASK